MTFSPEEMQALQTIRNHYGKEQSDYKLFDTIKPYIPPEEYQQLRKRMATKTLPEVMDEYLSGNLGKEEPTWTPPPVLGKVKPIEQPSRVVPTWTVAAGEKVPQPTESKPLKIFPAEYIADFMTHGFMGMERLESKTSVKLAEKVRGGLVQKYRGWTPQQVMTVLESKVPRDELVQAVRNGFIAPESDFPPEWVAEFKRTQPKVAAHIFDPSASRKWRGEYEPVVSAEAIARLQGTSPTALGRAFRESVVAPAATTLGEVGEMTYTQPLEHPIQAFFTIYGMNKAIGLVGKAAVMLTKNLPPGYGVKDLGADIRGYFKVTRIPLTRENLRNYFNGVSDPALTPEMVSSLKSLSNQEIDTLVNDLRAGNGEFKIVYKRTGKVEPATTPESPPFDYSGTAQPFTGEPLRPTVRPSPVERKALGPIPPQEPGQEALILGEEEAIPHYPGRNLLEGYKQPPIPFPASRLPQDQVKKPLPLRPVVSPEGIAMPQETQTGMWERNPITDESKLLPAPEGEVTLTHDPLTNIQLDRRFTTKTEFRYGKRVIPVGTQLTYKGTITDTQGRLSHQFQDAQGKTIKRTESAKENTEAVFNRYFGETGKPAPVKEVQVSPEPTPEPAKQVETPIQETMPATTETPAKEAYQMTKAEFAENIKRFDELTAEEKQRALKYYQQETGDMDVVERGHENYAYDKRTGYIVGEDPLHDFEVKQAITEGKPVPPEVLADYPELTKPATVKTPEVAEAKLPEGMTEAPELTPSQRIEDRVQDIRDYDQFKKAIEEKYRQKIVREETISGYSWLQLEDGTRIQVDWIEKGGKGSLIRNVKGKGRILQPSNMWNEYYEMEVIPPKEVSKPQTPGLTPSQRIEAMTDDQIRDAVNMTKDEYLHKNLPDDISVLYRRDIWDTPWDAQRPEAINKFLEQLSSTAKKYRPEQVEVVAKAQDAFMNENTAEASTLANTVLGKLHEPFRQAGAVDPRPQLEQEHRWIMREAQKRGIEIPERTARDYDITPPEQKNISTSQFPVQQVNIDEIGVKPDLMQFKRIEEKATGTNKAEKLKGTWDDLKGGIMLLWEPKNPAEYGLEAGQKYLVVNGHHRLQFGKEQGLKEFNAQVLREVDGYSVGDARRTGAEINITEGRGDIYDQVKFLREQAATHGKDATVGRAGSYGIKGRQASTIAFESGDSLYSAFINETITPEQAEIIARAAPLDETVQQFGIKQAVRGLQGDVLNHMIKASQIEKAQARGAGEQIDLFGQDDAAIQAMESKAKIVADFQKTIRQQINAVQGAAKRPDLAKKLGVDVTDPMGVQNRVQQLRQELAQWENWPMYPELVDRVNAKMSELSATAYKQTALDLTGKAQADLPTAIDDIFRRNQAIMTGDSMKVINEIDNLRQQNWDDKKILNNIVATTGLSDIRPLEANYGAKQVLDEMARRYREQPKQEVPLPEGMTEQEIAQLENAIKGSEKTKKGTTKKKPPTEMGSGLWWQRKPKKPSLMENENPTDRAVIDKYKQGISMSAKKKTLREELAESMNRKTLEDAYTFVVNRFQPINTWAKQTEKWTKKHGGYLADVFNPTYLISRYQSIKSIIDKQIWDNTSKLDMNTGEPVITGEGLKKVLEPVTADYEDFVSYVTALRDIELLSNDIKGSPMQEMVHQYMPSFKSISKSTYPIFEQAAADYTYWTKRAWLDPLYETGYLSESEYLAILEKGKHYATMRRVMEDMEKKGAVSPQSIQQLSPRGRALYELKGSDRMVINPIEEGIAEVHRITDFVARNEIAKSVVKLADVNPMVKASMKEVKGSGTNVIEYWENGERHFVQVPEDIYKAMNVLSVKDMAKMMRIASWPTRTLRAGATLALEFWARNPIRDQFTAFALAKYGYYPGYDFIQGVYSVLRKTEMYREARLAGADMDTFAAMDRLKVGRTIEDILKDRKDIISVKHPIEALRTISQFFEDSTRMGVYRRARLGGDVIYKALHRGGEKASPLEAAYEHRQATTDFLRRGGEFMKAVNQLVAFWNANVQGFDKMVRTARERPIDFMIRTAVGITIPALALYELNKNDPRYQSLRQDIKDRCFFICIPNGPMIMLPKPFELGILFGTTAERVAKFIDTRDPKAFDKLPEAIWNMAPGVLPTGIQPWLENSVKPGGYDFFRGRPIVPGYLQELAPEEQYETYTSETAKAMGSYLKWSPMKVENTVEGYFGGLGRTGLWLSDQILKNAGVTKGPEKPTPVPADFPLIRGFIPRAPIGSQSQQVQDFYDLYRKSDQANNTIKRFQKRGQDNKLDKFQKEHPEAEWFKGLSSLARYFTRINANKQQIYDDPNLTPEQKRKLLDEQDVIMTKEASHLLEVYKNSKKDGVMSEAGVSETGPEGLPIPAK